MSKKHIVDIVKRICEIDGDAIRKHPAYRDPRSTIKVATSYRHLLAQCPDERLEVMRKMTLLMQAAEPRSIKNMDLILSKPNQKSSGGSNGF